MTNMQASDTTMSVTIATNPQQQVPYQPTFTSSSIVLLLTHVIYSVTYVNIDAPIVQLPNKFIASWILS